MADALNKSSRNIMQFVAQSVIQRLEWRETRIAELEAELKKVYCHTCEHVGKTYEFACENCGVIRLCEFCVSEVESERCPGCATCARCGVVKRREYITEFCSNGAGSWCGFHCNDCENEVPRAVCICDRPLYSCCEPRQNITCENCRKVYCSWHEPRMANTCKHCHSGVICIKCQICYSCENEFDVTVFGLLEGKETGPIADLINERIANRKK